jgi:hypothetical protein
MREQQVVSIDSDCSRCGGSGLCTADSPGIQHVCICVRFEAPRSSGKPLAEIAADVVATQELHRLRRVAKAFEKFAEDLEPMGNGLLAQEARNRIAAAYSEDASSELGTCLCGAPARHPNGWCGEPDCKAWVDRSAAQVTPGPVGPHDLNRYRCHVACLHDEERVTSHHPDCPRALYQEILYLQETACVVQSHSPTR